MNDTSEATGTDSPEKTPRIPLWTRFLGYVKRKENERRTKKESVPALDRAARLTSNATIWIAIFTCVSIVVNAGMFLILRRQLNLTRQEVVGQYAAIIQFRVDPPAKNSNAISVSFLNGGEIPSPVAYANFQITIAAFPNGEVLWKSETYKRIAYQIGKNSNGGVWDFDVPLIESSDSAYLTQKRTVRIEGTYTYDNGFGDKISIPVCQSLLGFYTLYHPDGSSNSDGNRFLDCADMASKLIILNKAQLSPYKKQPTAQPKLN